MLNANLNSRHRACGAANLKMRTLLARQTRVICSKLARIGRIGVGLPIRADGNLGMLDLAAEPEPDHGSGRAQRRFQVAADVGAFRKRIDRVGLLQDAIHPALHIA